MTKLKPLEARCMDLSVENDELRGEVKRLREALKHIAHPQYGLGFNKLRGLARAALASKEATT